MQKTPKSQLRDFLGNLTTQERELVIATLNLQIAARPPLSESEKQSKLEAYILKQAD